MLIGSASLQDVFADLLLPQREMSRGAIVSSDLASSSSRAIVKNMKIIVKYPAKNFVATLVLRLRGVPHLRVTAEIAKNE